MNTIASTDLLLHNIPVDVQKRATAAATREGLTLSDLIRRLLNQFLRDEQKHFYPNGIPVEEMEVSPSQPAKTFRDKSVDELTVEVDELLLSCRILGRGIEEAFFKTVLNLLRLDGYRKVKAAYLPTAKNGQTADFFDRMGMTCVDQGSDGTKCYQMELNDIFEIKNYYNIRVL